MQREEARLVLLLQSATRGHQKSHTHLYSALAGRCLHRYLGAGSVQHPNNMSETPVISSFSPFLPSVVWELNESFCSGSPHAHSQSCTSFASLDASGSESTSRLLGFLKKEMISLWKWKRSHQSLDNPWFMFKWNSFAHSRGESLKMREELTGFLV